LGIVNCLTKIVNYSPTTGFASGIDGSTGFNGIKWNVDEDFSDGTFSFTLDTSYQARAQQVLVKAGTGTAQLTISGPDCSLPNPDASSGDEQTPDTGDSGDSSGGSGGNACAFSWIDWNGGVSSQMELAGYMADPSLSGTHSLNEVLTRGPDVVYSSAVAAQLNSLVDAGSTVKIPLTSSNGAICGFANVKLLDYQLQTGDNWLNLQFLQTLIHGTTTDPDAPDYGARDVRMKK
jgi:hypothetical protein